MINLPDNIVVNNPVPVDSTMCNYYPLGNSIIVETMAQYLTRVPKALRRRNIEILMIQEAGIVSLESFATFQSTCTIKKYVFKDGVEDINFVESIGSKFGLEDVSSSVARIMDMLLHAFKILNAGQAILQTTNSELQLLQGEAYIDTWNDNVIARCKSIIEEFIGNSFLSTLSSDSTRAAYVDTYVDNTPGDGIEKYSNTSVVTEFTDDSNALNKISLVSRIGSIDGVVTRDLYFEIISNVGPTPVTLTIKIPDVLAVPTERRNAIMPISVNGVLADETGNVDLSSLATKTELYDGLADCVANDTYNQGFIVQHLTGLTPSLNVVLGVHSDITITGNTTLTISNLIAGTSGNITITNPATAYTLTVAGYTNRIAPAIYNAANTIGLSGGSKIDVLSWYYDGTYLIWNGSQDYK